MSKKMVLSPRPKPVRAVVYSKVRTDPCWCAVSSTPPASDLTTVCSGKRRNRLAGSPTLLGEERRDTMSRCNFCDGEFKNSQAVKGHLRRCPNYQKIKHGHAARIQSFTAPRPMATAEGPPAPTMLTTASTLLDQITRQCAGPDEATQLKQKREALLAGLCANLVDWYYPVESVVTPDMAAAAKVAILDELGVLPIETLSQTELTLRGTAIRNRVFGPYLRRQQEQAERQQERQQQDALRRQGESDTRSRRTPHAKPHSSNWGSPGHSNRLRHEASPVAPSHCSNGKSARDSRPGWWATRLNSRSTKSSRPRSNDLS